MRADMPVRAVPFCPGFRLAGLLFLAVPAGLAASLACSGCDEPHPDTAAGDEPAPPPPRPAPAPAAEEVRAPEIIIDRSSVAIGHDSVATGEPSFADKVGALLNGKPGVAGGAVDMVAMRTAKPSQVAAVAAVLHAANAASVRVKTEARDQTTQALPLSFDAPLADCAVVAWIAKDGVIDVWPAGGGAAKRVARGLAGPDMTLGTDAIRAQGNGCSASAIAVGAEDTMTWGLVFDLGTSALGAPGARADRAALLTAAVPGKKL